MCLCLCFVYVLIVLLVWLYCLSCDCSLQESFAILFLLIMICCFISLFSAQRAIPRTGCGIAFVTYIRCRSSLQTTFGRSRPTGTFAPQTGSSTLLAHSFLSFSHCFDVFVFVSLLPYISSFTSYFHISWFHVLCFTSLVFTFCFHMFFHFLLTIRIF
jgi:hypothetical protein